MRCLLLAGVALWSVATTWAEIEPVVELNIDVQEWLQPLPAVNEVKLAAAAMGLSKAAFAIYVDGGLVPVARLETSMAPIAASFLADTNKTGLIMVSPNEFRLASSEQRDMALQLFQLEDLVIRIEDDAVLLGSPNRLDLARNLADHSISSSIAEGAVQLVPLIDPFLAAANTFVESQDEGFGKAILGGMLKSLDEALTSLEAPPGVSFEVTVPEAGRRMMRLWLAFPSALEAKSAHAFFEHVADAWKDPAATDQQIALGGLADSPYFQALECKNENLEFNYGWPAEDDRAMLESIGKPLGSILYSFMRQSDYPSLSEEVRAAPNLEVGGIDSDAFVRDVRDALYFAHLWNHSVDYELDWFDPPGADFMETTVSNVVLISAHGEDLVPSDKSARFTVDEHKKSARISLPRPKEGPPPERASFSLNFQIPSSIKTIPLSADDPLYEIEEGGVCLISISNSTVTLRAKGVSLRDAKVFALNDAGEYLRGKSASWSDARYGGTFRGRPSSVQLVFAEGAELISLDFMDVPATKESKLKMPTNPTNEIPTRYTLEPVEAYISPDLDAVAAGGVSYVTNGGWKKNERRLVLEVQEHVKVEGIAFETWLAGCNEIAHQGSQGGGYSGGKGVYTKTLMHTNSLDRATALYGEMRVEMRDAVEHYTTDLTTNAVSLSSERLLPKVSVEGNVIWVERDRAGKVLSIQAFGEDGRRLKKDNRTSFKDQMRGNHFWGRPARVALTYSATNAFVSLPFEFELKPNGLADIPAAKERAIEFGGLVDELSAIKKNAGNWGNLLARAYYEERGNGKPKKAIPLEAAHADPNGADVFGYELKPYRGYYLKMIPSERDAAREHEARTRKWSGGEFETPSYSSMMLARPVGPDVPAFLFLWGSDVFVKYGACADHGSITTNRRGLEADGWIRIR